ncbi:MAG: hypothetical protein IJH07_02975, partial [Ruminococcus sp.]|nr:hypothetical protein [Ruminococcus sp.]
LSSISHERINRELAREYAGHIKNCESQLAKLENYKSTLYENLVGGLIPSSTLAIGLLSLGKMVKSRPKLAPISLEQNYTLLQQHVQAILISQAKRPTPLTVNSSFTLTPSVI